MTKRQYWNIPNQVINALKNTPLFYWAPSDTNSRAHIDQASNQYEVSLYVHNEVQVIWKHLMTQLNKTTPVLTQSKHLGPPHCSSVGRSVCQNECQKLSKTRFREYLWLSNCTVTLTQMNSFSLALKEKKRKARC